MAEAADRKQLSDALDDGKENSLKKRHVDPRCSDPRRRFDFRPSAPVRRYNLLAGADVVKSRRAGRCLRAQRLGADRAMERVGHKQQPLGRRAAAFGLPHLALL